MDDSIPKKFRDKSSKKQILGILEYGYDMFLVNGGDGLASKLMDDQIRLFKKEFKEDLQ